MIVRGLLKFVLAVYTLRDGSALIFSCDEVGSQSGSNEAYSCKFQDGVSRNKGHSCYEKLLEFPRMQSRSSTHAWVVRFIIEEAK